MVHTGQDHVYTGQELLAVIVPGQLCRRVPDEWMH